MEQNGKLSAWQRRNREEELKLAMLEAIARSQRALARMLESAAETVRWSDGDAGSALRLLDSIERCQRVLAAKHLGVPYRRMRSGTPSAAWLSRRVAGSRGRKSPAHAESLSIASGTDVRMAGREFRES
jgi:hypothetical protein